MCSHVDGTIAAGYLLPVDGEVIMTDAAIVSAELPPAPPSLPPARSSLDLLSMVFLLILIGWRVGEQ
jgi:hypothetical protein